MFDLYQEFQKLITGLQEHQIEYAVCGGLAMAVYDHPRATADIDLLILSESLAEAMEVAKDLDYTIRGLDMTFAKGAIEIRRISKIDSETGIVLSLDLILVTPEIQQIWDSRVQTTWEYGRFSVVSREGLIKLKEMGGRPQDVADIVSLKEDSENASN